MLPKYLYDLKVDWILKVWIIIARSIQMMELMIV